MSQCCQVSGGRRLRPRIVLGGGAGDGNRGARGRADAWRVLCRWYWYCQRWYGRWHAQWGQEWHHRIRWQRNVPVGPQETKWGPSQWWYRTTGWWWSWRHRRRHTEHARWEDGHGPYRGPADGRRQGHGPWLEIPLQIRRSVTRVQNLQALPHVSEGRGPGAGLPGVDDQEDCSATNPTTSAHYMVIVSQGPEGSNEVFQILHLLTLVQFHGLRREQYVETF